MQALTSGFMMVGAVRGTDSTTGRHYDDTLAYIDQVGLTDEQRARVLEQNARRVFPRFRHPEDEP